LTDIPVIACLEGKERGRDANVQRELKHGKQEKTAEGDKVIFHDHKLIFHDQSPGILIRVMDPRLAVASH